MSRTRGHRALVAAVSVMAILSGCSDQPDPSRAVGPSTATQRSPADMASQRVQLRQMLARHRFTGRVGSSLESRLGRPVNAKLADIGRLLWFDNISGLNNDNSCAGCHSPLAGFGDPQSIAIGIENNNIVGPHRTGPRNQRRSPMVLNSAFYPRLMWNSRFVALSGNPFDNTHGFRFPAPEGLSLSTLAHLLQAQVFIPPTERVEMAGFGFPGSSDDIRAEVVRRINAADAYATLFRQAFPGLAAGEPFTYEHFARAIAEFEFTLTFADAPIDRFARGADAMADPQVRGAVLFFGRAGCVRCHAVGGESNEMFSDFRDHVIGVPQVTPSVGNVLFDGPGANEDFGREQVTGYIEDRYRFRTSPIRNVALQPTFMHNGAFVRLEDAIRHHLDPVTSARAYTPRRLAPDLQGGIGPVEPVLARLDPLVRTPVTLTETEFADLLAFVREGLLDARARPEVMRALIPGRVPSGRPVMHFEVR